MLSVIIMQYHYNMCNSGLWQNAKCYFALCYNAKCLNGEICRECWSTW
jgi:hypothetical protein